MEKNTKLEYEINKHGDIEQRSAKDKDLGNITEHDSGMITEKDKMSMAKQILLYSFLSFIFLVSASFIPVHHDNQLIQFAQQILPVVTLIIGSYFNK